MKKKNYGIVRHVKQQFKSDDEAELDDDRKGNSQRLFVSVSISHYKDGKYVTNTSGLSKKEGLLSSHANYRKNRENGCKDDSPPSQCPKDGKVEWLEEADEFYSVRYTEGEKDKQWMEEKDRNYISRLVRTKHQRQLTDKECAEIEEGMQRADIAARINQEEHERELSYQKMGLLKAARQNLPTVIRYLLMLDIDLNEQDAEGKTALHYLIIHEQIDLAQQLLTKRISINRVSKEGRTELHYAVLQGNIQLVKSLVEMGAQVLVGDALGQTPKDLAKIKDNSVVIQYLQQAEESVLGASPFIIEVQLKRRRRTEQISMVETCQQGEPAPVQQQLPDSDSDDQMIRFMKLKKKVDLFSKYKDELILELDRRKLIGIDRLNLTQINKNYDESSRTIQLSRLSSLWHLPQQDKTISQNMNEVYTSLMQGRIQEARSLFNSLAILGQNNVLMLRFGAMVYHTSGDQIMALRYIAQALTLEPDDEKSLIIRSQIYHDLDHYAYALADVNQVLEKTPDDIWLLQYRCYLKLILQEKDDAALLTDLNCAIALSSNKVVLLYRRAKINRLCKSFVAALEDLRQCFELEPNNLEIIVYRGWVHYELKDFQKALKDFQQALQLDPLHTDTLRGIGKVYYKQAQYDEALKVYNQLLKIDSTNEKLLHKRVSIYMALGSYDDALCECTRILNNVISNRKNFLVTRGLVYREMREYCKALKDFKALLKQDSNDVWALVHMANSYYYLGKFSKAEFYCNRAIKLDANDNYAWFTKGIICLEQEKYQNALQSFDRALKLKKEYVEYILHFRGKVYTKLGRYSDALEDLNRGLKMVTSEGLRQDFYVSRGKLFQTQHQHKKARQDFERVLEFEKDKEHQPHTNSLQSLIKDMPRDVRGTKRKRMNSF